MKRIAVFFSCALASLAPAIANAQVGQAAQDGNWIFKAVLAVSAALAIGMAVVAGTMSQAKAAAVTLEGIARNPEAASKVMTPMIIALALIESLVIYALVIAFLLQGKI
ncbi:MAG: ATP synthase F0 subunit C [bacterium]